MNMTASLVPDMARVDASARETVEAIYAADFSQFDVDTGDTGISREVAEAHFRMLLTAYVTGPADKHLAPTKAADIMWHSVDNDSAQWAPMAQRLLGRMMLHDPKFAATSPETLSGLERLKSISRDLGYPVDEMVAEDDDGVWATTWCILRERSQSPALQWEQCAA